MSIVRGGLWEVRKIEWLETRGRRTTRVWREIAIFSAALQKCSSNWCAHYKENKQATKCSIGRSINQTCSVLIMAATMHFVQGTQRHTQTESHQQLQLCLALVFAWCNWEKSRQENQKKQNKKCIDPRVVSWAVHPVNLVLCHVVSGYTSLLQTVPLLFEWQPHTCTLTCVLYTRGNKLRCLNLLSW